MTIPYPRICSSWRLVLHQLQFVTEHLLSTQLTWDGGFSSLPPLLLLMWKELATLCTATAKAMGEAGIYTHPCDGDTSGCGMSSWSKQPYCPSVSCLFSPYCTASLCCTAPVPHVTTSIPCPVLTLPSSQHHPQGWGSSGSRCKWGTKPCLVHMGLKQNLWE